MFCPQLAISTTASNPGCWLGAFATTTSSGVPANPSPFWTESVSSGNQPCPAIVHAFPDDGRFVVTLTLDINNLPVLKLMNAIGGKVNATFGLGAALNISGTDGFLPVSVYMNRDGVWAFP